MRFACQECGKGFENGHRRKYCSQECYWKALKRDRIGEHNPYIEQSLKPFLNILKGDYHCR